MKVLDLLKKPFSSINSSGRLGTFSGVFIPNILQMLGIVLFIRFAFILSEVGIYSLLAMIGLSSALLLITGMSMSSIVTNMKMGSGGIYYVISRSLGIHLGSSIGFLLLLAQITTIALCVSGSALIIQELIPSAPLIGIEGTILFALALISYFSTRLTSFLQILIFGLLAITFYSISEGHYDASYKTDLPLVKTTFWGAFAVIFAALTGIESGMSLSGDLKNPSKALPLGTLLSIVIAFIIYVVFALFIKENISFWAIQEDPSLIITGSKFPKWALAGMLGTTLSSAMSNLLGAPRTIEALAKDRVLPKFLSGSEKESSVSLTSMLLTCIAAFVIIIATNINQIIPLLTMICLMFYALLNFVSSFESFMQNPSWRPAFVTPWYVSFIGCITCLLSMLLIHSHMFLIFFVFLGMIYVMISTTKIQNNWDDIRYSILSTVVRICLEKLKSLRMNAKSWRPHLLTIAEASSEDNCILPFASSINHNHGLLTYCLVSQHEEEEKISQKVIVEKLRAGNINCFLKFNQSPYFFDEMDHLVKHYGLGPLAPNTILMSHRSIHDPQLLAKTILGAYDLSRNFLILKTGNHSESIFLQPSKKQTKKIDIWWGGSYRKNVDLCLAISQMLQKGSSWKNSNITIKSMVSSFQERGEILNKASEYYSILRMKELSFDPIVDEKGDFYDCLVSHSLHSSHLIFIGLRPPKFDESIASYSEYLSELLTKTEILPNVVYLLAGEKLNFLRIFEQRQ